MHRMQRTILAILALTAGVAAAPAQELPPSGVLGFDVFTITSPGGVSQLVATSPSIAPGFFPVGRSVDAVPSRWAHRRRTLGALETAVLFAEPLTFFTPMGDSAGAGAIHMVDLRSGVTSQLVPTENPAAYDLIHDASRKFLFCAEDDGNGDTVLRGYSYAAANLLVPLSPPSLVLAGAPSASVNRMSLDRANGWLHVPTVEGVHVIALHSSSPQMTVLHSLQTGSFVPATNPAHFDRAGIETWVMGTCRYDPAGLVARETGYALWDASGALETGSFGTVTRDPAKRWVPAAGAEEVAVVGDGIDTYVYLLLREPAPGTFYIKGAAVGVVRVLGLGAADVGILDCSDECGEPFAIPTVSGTRVAFETSFGPPFVDDPPDGGERVNVIYAPLDPLGAKTDYGLLAVPGPLGGRISTKGMDRPLWSRDGSRIYACTSHFPGAPNPGMPGLEVLDVPASIPLDTFSSPHTVVENPDFPNQSIVFPSAFDPRDPSLARFLDGLSFTGNVFHDGMASALGASFGDLGQKQSDAFEQSPNIPNFPALLPATFDDANGSIVPIPAAFGARRTAFNLSPGVGIEGLMMSAAIGDRLLIQPTGHDFLAELGLVAPLPPIVVPLPTHWVTTTELLSL